MDLKVCFLTVTVVLVALARGITGEIVDMRRAIATVMKLHNDQRRDRNLQASDMLQMVWDERLAQQAREHASRCTYRRPDTSEYGAGANLYAGRDFVVGEKSIRDFVSYAIQRWIDHKDNYYYDTDCRRACPYVQIINSRSDRIGCALNTCDRLEYNGSEKRYISLLVCLYSPRLRNGIDYPFTRGTACSFCPRGYEDCRDQLCARPGENPLPSYANENDIYDPSRPTGPAKDMLSSTEEYYLRVVHNNIRARYIDRPMEWDSYLDRWANWIVRCEADYPGPAGTYTNFHRLNQGEQVYNVLYQWETEGNNTHLRLEHGCRTPMDHTECNHLTNILQLHVNKMACAARDCLDGTRQLVCLYDREVDRQYYNNRQAQQYPTTTEAPPQYVRWVPNQPQTWESDRNSARYRRQRSRAGRRGQRRRQAGRK